jgi:hypothetical protein
MSEATKTSTYAGAALAVLVIALVTRPQPPRPSETATSETMLNAVDDPFAATQLKVVKYDEGTSSVRTFEVAKRDGLWVIPSHQDYPADAQTHMADAATSVMNLTILRTATNNRGDHKTYGVVAPDVEKLEAGSVGVGTHVTMEDAKRQKLADIIIGKEVKDQPGQRYVRNAGQDPVYVVKLDPAKLTTRFEDWIEADLLKLNAWDVSKVVLKDYSAELQLDLASGSLTPTWDPRSEMTFSYSDSDAKWTAEELKVFNTETKQFEAVTLAEDEEPNKDKLNDLKNALDDLKIVDVERKPDGLSKDLKANQEFAKNREALQNLAARGFIPVMLGEVFEVLSNEGEVLCQMKDGVEYVLRFGKLVLSSGSDAEKKVDAPSEANDAAGEAKEGGTGIHRYLFVTARFKDATIAQPQLEDLPELPQGASAPPPAESAPATGTQPPSEGAQESTGQEPSAGQPPAQSGGDQTEPQNNEPPAAEGDESSQASEKVQEPAAEGQQENTDAKDAAVSEKTGEGEKQDKQLEELIKKRKEIETENQRKLDEYQDKIKKGKDREKELNDRFGDWYYVISDEVYKKIHLGRDDVIKKKEAEKKEGDPAAPGAAGITVPDSPAAAETGDDAGGTPDDATDAETKEAPDEPGDEAVKPD